MSDKADTSLHHDPAEPLNAAETQAIADRMRIRSYSSLIGAIVTLVALIAFVIAAVILLSREDRGTQLTAQTNCARNYGSILNKPVTLRDNLTSQVAALVGDGQGIFGKAILNLENGIQPAPDVIVAFQQNQTALEQKTVELDKAISVVRAEPTVAFATVHGFTFAGTHHPACPGE